MVSGKIKVIWSHDAMNQLKVAYNYIKKSSPQNAKKVRSDISGITKSLSLNPTKFQADKYKDANDGSYRAFEKHKYRVAYRILEKEIRILRIRHTGMEPKIY